MENSKILEILLKGKVDWTSAIKQTQIASNQMVKEFRKAFNVPISTSNAALSPVANSYYGILQKNNAQQNALFQSQSNNRLSLLRRESQEILNETRSLNTRLGVTGGGRSNFRQSLDDASGGYGKYLMGYMLGGQMGATGIALGGWAKKFGAGYKSRMVPGQINVAGTLIGGGGRLLGGAMLGAGALVNVGRLASSAYKGTANLLGLNQNGLQGFIEFDKALRVAALNMKAGGSNFEDSMKVFRNAAMSMATTYGSAGTATDFVTLMRSMAGLPSLKTPQQVAEAARVAASFSMITEGTSPEMVGKGLVSIQAALVGQGKKGYGLKGIASAMYTSGAMALGDVGEIASNSKRISEFINMGGSLEEALGIYTLLRNIGYTAPTAGTQLSSYKRQSIGVAGKVVRAGVVGNADEWIRMSASQQMMALINRAKQEGLNPETSTAMQQIAVKIFGQKGGAFFQTLTSPENRNALETFIKAMKNAGNSTKVFDDAIQEITDSVGNRVANAKNAFSNIQLESQKAMFPLLGYMAEKFTISSELMRLQQTNGTGTDEYKALLARSKRINAPGYYGTLLGETRGQFSPNSSFQSIVNIGDSLVKAFSPFIEDPGAIKTTFDGIIGAFKMATGVLQGFMSVLMWGISIFGSPESRAKLSIYNQTGRDPRAWSIPDEKALGAKNSFISAQGKSLLSGSDFSTDKGGINSFFNSVLGETAPNTISTQKNTTALGILGGKIDSLRESLNTFKINVPASQPTK